MEWLAGLVVTGTEDLPVLAAEADETVQRAWYRHGRSLSDPATYAEIGWDFGLDADAVATAAASQQARERARREFDEADALDVHEYPTLLLTVDGAARRLGGPDSKPAQLIAHLDAAVAAAA